MKFDLHVHSSYSDGTFIPEEIVKLAVERKLDGIAITDHDSISGIAEAVECSKRYPGFRVIPGIEFGCMHNGEEVHILGYFIDYKSCELLETLEMLKQSRIERSYEIIKKLNGFGVKINIEDVQALGKDGFIGRVHIAKILIKQGYVENIQEAFNRYLKIGRPAYVPRNSLDIKDCIKLIKDNGGLPVLAHPGLLKNKSVMDYCVQEGIMGIECIHSKHSQSETKKFIRFAYNNKLIATGGSDCHGQLTNGNLLLGKFYCNIENGDDFSEYL